MKDITIDTIVCFPLTMDAKTLKDQQMISGFICMII